MITKLRARMLAQMGGGTQNKLADILGIRRATLSEYVTGLRDIPPAHLQLLSEALHCSPRDLVGYVEMEGIRK